MFYQLFDNIVGFKDIMKPSTETTKYNHESFQLVPQIIFDLHTMGPLDTGKEPFWWKQPLSHSPYNLFYHINGHI